MARPLRIEFQGGVYHVTARGNDHRVIFEDDSDRARFLAVLESVVDRYHVVCHAYCLMDNHYHLLLETLEANLSLAMRQLNGVYGQRFNRRHDRSGHLLEGRFKAQVVDRDAYLREVCRYIVLNPVRAGLVHHPAEWFWSSYRATVGAAPTPAFLTVDWVLALGAAPSRAAAQDRYRRFVEAGLEGSRAARADLGERLIVGEGKFARDLAERLAPAAALKEVPRSQRFVTRPSLAALFDGVTSLAQRNARCALAVNSYGYTMKEVADFLGLHYATVSRAIGQAGENLPSGHAMLDFKT